MISMFCIPITVSLITLFLYADTMSLWILIPQVIITVSLLVGVALSEVYCAKKERIQEKRIELLNERVRHLTDAVELMSSAMIDKQLNTDKDK